MSEASGGVFSVDAMVELAEVVAWGDEVGGLLPNEEEGEDEEGADGGGESVVSDQGSDAGLVGDSEVIFVENDLGWTIKNPCKKLGVMSFAEGLIAEEEGVGGEDYGTGVEGAFDDYGLAIGAVEDRPFWGEIFEVEQGVPRDLGFERGGGIWGFGEEGGGFFGVRKSGKFEAPGFGDGVKGEG